MDNHIRSQQNRIQQMKKYPNPPMASRACNHVFQQFNQKAEFDSDLHPVNGRRLTNLGVFRQYLNNYLENNSKVDHSQPLMVRQLSSNMEGIPLEIYCFTNTIIWEDYEAIQSDIFDHVFAAAKYFGLEIQEALGSNDLRDLSSVLRGKNFNFNS